MDRRPDPYVEDDETDGVDDRMEEAYRDHFEVHLHERPDFGYHRERKKVSTMVVEIPVESYSWLTKRHKMRLIERGRLPSVWVEKIKERFGPPSPGYILLGYTHVDVQLRQQRLSDTDGGLRPTGRIRVQLKVGMDFSSGDMVAKSE